MDLDTIRLEAHRVFIQRMDSLMNFGREQQCFSLSMFTPGKARLPRKLKKATKKFLRYYNKTSMVIMPQAQFVCLNKKKES